MAELNKKHYQAIELKYEGKTYKQIAQLIEIGEGTLESWFVKDGLLYIQYLDYAKKKNEERTAEAENVFKSNVKNATDAIISALKRASKNKNDEKAVEYAKEILDRAGLAVVKKSEVKRIAEEEMTDEQFYKELERIGIITRKQKRSVKAVKN